MKTRTVLSGAALAAVTVFLFGCTQGTQGIFSELEQEEKIFSNNLGDGLVAELVLLPSSGDNAPTYVVRKGVRLSQRRAVQDDRSGEGIWQVIQPPPGRTGAQFLAVTTDTLYGVYFTGGNSLSFGLYEYQRNPEANAVGNWGENLYTGETLDQITGLSAVDLTGDGAAETLLMTAYARSTGTSGPRSLVVNPHDTPRTLAMDGGGDDMRRAVVTTSGPAGAESTVWIVGNGLQYTTATNITSGSAALTLAPAPVGFSDLAVYRVGTTEWLIATTVGGDIYAVAPENADDADAWQEVGSRSGTSFTTLAVVSDGTAEGLLVFGTGATRSVVSRGLFDGAFSLVDGFPSISLREPRGNYSSTQIRTTSVDRFFVDRITPADIDDVETLRLFALTPNLGLFRADDYSGGADETWISE